MIGIHQQRAFAAMQLHQYDIARREAAAALAEDPDDRLGRLLLGEACMRLNDFAAGREQATELLRLAPDWAWGYWLMAWCRLLDRARDGRPGGKAARLQHARQAAQEALSLDPMQTPYFEVAAAVAMEMDDQREALHLIEQGLALAPECQFLHRLRGQVLGLLRQPGLAAEAFEASLRSAPEDALTHRELARLLFSSGQYCEARRHIEEAMRLAPDDDVARQLLMQIVQTQHWLLRGAIWFHQATRLVRRLFPLWVFGAVFVGLFPVLAFGERDGVPPWQQGVAYMLWLAVILLPLETLVLPLVTNMLWVIIGRDAARRSLTRQEQWDRMAPGVFVLAAVPMMIMAATLESVVPVVVFLATSTLALLQSGAARRTSRLARGAVYLVALIYAIFVASRLIQQREQSQADDFVIIDFFVLIVVFAWRTSAGAMKHCG